MVAPTPELLEPVDVTLVSKWVVIDVIRGLGVRASWINQMGPKSNDKCPYKK